ncbi:hypothetical protein LSH36_54g04005 [Paralvinella palmiformis]|uniref:Uncharacterized protein n=1 Tax=Paralvinella palmiformis TaxID=53620 RepID=A0AAD9K5X3_9ANNE|nr:hypothetical protein LSH36_54g04005 [Paralvinella palmiformis]
MDTDSAPDDKSHVEHFNAYKAFGDNPNFNNLKLPELPSYDIATTLPSYEEAEQTKQTEEEHHQQVINLSDEEPQTIAARFGAVSGFGLSIVKYVAVMKTVLLKRTTKKPEPANSPYLEKKRRQH